jgi:hypothetical protein
VARRDCKRALKFFQLRDQSASAELLFPLFQLGYWLGETLVLLPPERGKGTFPPRSLRKVDISFIKAGDKIVQTTRAPIHDLNEGTKRQIERNFTDLEERLFLAWSAYVTYLARTRVTLARAFLDKLKPGFESRADMKFRQRGCGAPYHHVKASDGSRWQPGPDGRTAVFLLNLEEAWVGGPGYVCAFGMDGTATLIWNYRLRHDFAHLLERPGFYVGEMEIGKVPSQIQDLRWCMDWKIELFLGHEAEPESHLMLAR